MHGHHKEITRAPGTVRALNTHFFQPVYQAQDLLALLHPDNKKILTEKGDYPFREGMNKKPEPLQKITSCCWSLTAHPFIHELKNIRSIINLNDLKDTMMQKHAALITVLVITFFIAAMVIPALAADGPSNDALPRGGRFTITVTGTPKTPYYIWLTRTFTMTGKPGDQPPIIIGYQGGIQQDPPNGPYTIGLYAFNNGNGRTILNDIAPSTPEMSNTNYYALVTTDADGRAVVAFQTSSGTATRTFSIKVENLQSAAKDTILIERGLPVRVPTTSAPEFPTFLPTTPAPALIRTASPAPTTIVFTIIPVPIRTSPQQSPLWMGFCILSVVAGYVILRER